MIKVENAKQMYGSQLVFEEGNFTIEIGETVAIVGRNGAGKTTLLHALIGLSRLKKGKITFNEKPVHRPSTWNKRLSYLPEKFQLYPQLSVLENLAYFADLYHVVSSDCKRVLLATDMWEHRDKRMDQLSKGMLQRVGISVAMLGEPKWMVFDEPTSGLDPFGREDLIQLMQMLQTGKRTIIFTTHHMNEVKDIATHVLFLDEQKVRKMTVHEFFRQVEGRFSA